MACRCLNKNAHPEPTRGCSECCGMCCGYTTPAVIGFMIAGLVITSDVYSFILIGRNPHSAWRVIVCLIAFLFTTFFGVVVNWAYYQILFTSPGYVPREVWQHPPTYVGPPPPAPRDNNAVQVHFPSNYNTNGNTSSNSNTANHNVNGVSGAQATSAGTAGNGSQHLAPTMARRSPNQSGDVGPQQAYPLRPVLPPPMLTDSANPLRSTENNEDNCGDVQKTCGEARVEGAPVAAIVYSDGSGENGSDPTRGRPAHEQRRQHGHDSHRTSHETGSRDVPALTPEQLAKAPEMAAVGVRTDRHSPYATPNGTSSLALAAGLNLNEMNNTSNNRNVNNTASHVAGGSPLNPYTVRERAANGSLRYCHRCRMYKPDGAHHCSVCQRCVFNFDHHCPFVNNCVGRNNYKLFVVFVLYGGVGALLSGGLMAVTLFAVDRDEIMSKIGWVAVPAVDVILGLSLLLFWVQHQCLLSKGESTLDSIARGDDTFQGWRASLSRPRKTAAEKAEERRQKRLKVERHQRTLLGNESPWWRRYLPIPVRTDDSAEDTVPGNV